MARRRPSPRTIAVIRDLVEVVAILAAGAWALYTFVYDQRIKPASEPPSVVLTGSLQRVGERGDKVQMQYHVTLRNTGQTRIYTIADGIVAVGLRYVPSRTATTWTPAPGVTEYARSVQPRPPVRSEISGRFQDRSRRIDPVFRHVLCA